MATVGHFKIITKKFKVGVSLTSSQNYKDDYYNDDDKILIYLTGSTFCDLFRGRFNIQSHSVFLDLCAFFLV
jgi:hypothetical protein